MVDRLIYEKKHECQVVQINPYSCNSVYLLGHNSYFQQHWFASVLQTYAETNFYYLFMTFTVLVFISVNLSLVRCWCPAVHGAPSAGELTAAWVPRLSGSAGSLPPITRTPDHSPHQHRQLQRQRIVWYTAQHSTVEDITHKRWVNIHIQNFCHYY